MWDPQPIPCQYCQWEVVSAPFPPASQGHSILF